MLNQSTFPAVKNPPDQTSFFSQPLGSLRTLRARIIQAAARRRGRYELNQLSDNELADIGLSRTEIHSAVYGRAK